MVYKVYVDGLLGGNLGGSAAQSVILMIIVIGLTAVQFRFVERKVTY
jgi:sn-glycerol 3-phosphate transport system permease protein